MRVHGAGALALLPVHRPPRLPAGCRGLGSQSLCLSGMVRPCLTMPSSYFDGKPSYARLTGCWDDAYEIYAWSNVVCVPRTHALYPEMEKESLRHKHFPAAYFS